MAKKGPAPAAAEGAAKKKKSFPVPISTIVTLAIALPVGWWCYSSYKKWAGGRAVEVDARRKLAEIKARNAVMKVIYDNTQLRKFYVSNKTSDTVTVQWLAAAYHDGKKVLIFDSDQCKDFKQIVLEAGGESAVLLRSSQPGCNWDGSVFYYAMRYTQENETEENYRIFNMIGPYQGFERDTYNFR
jgi:hypothetical protein